MACPVTCSKTVRCLGGITWSTHYSIWLFNCIFCGLQHSCTGSQ